MLIQAVRLYEVPGEPRGRQVRSQGTIERARPGRGPFTPSAGFRVEQPGEVVQYKDDAPQPSFDLMLRMEMDGGWRASTQLASGFHADDLVWQAIIAMRPTK